MIKAQNDWLKNYFRFKKRF